ncbi:hypothetical protein Tco_0773594 [Tanacetum coccineum]|uniref:Retrotransposon gag domain-containing protein n=1 Tax=Tanacetum coccineum TaxID=301880 RepID=A0ABQ4ZL58_9ASTR
MMGTPDLNGTLTTPCLANPNLAETKTKFKIENSKEMLMMLHNNAYNGDEANDAVDHITRFLQIIDLVKIPNVDQKQLCILAFSHSLTGKAREWWMLEGNDKITSWVELVDKFFYKYYPLSRASKSNNDNEKGYDNATLIDDEKSSDNECDKSNLMNHYDTNPSFDPYLSAKDKGLPTAIAEVQIAQTSSNFHAGAC